MSAASTLAADEQETVALIVPEVARFLPREVRGAEIDRQGEIPASVREGAAALGLFGLTIPIEYGSAGLSLASTSRIVAEIARVDRSVAIMIGLHAGLGTRGLVEHRSPALKSEWLPRLAAGACIASFAATEASAGSDLTAIRTAGESTARGLRVDGEKSYVTNRGFAGLFTTLVRTPGLGGGRALSLVAIPRGTPGVGIGREEDKLGIRGSSAIRAAAPSSRMACWRGAARCCRRGASGPRVPRWTRRSRTWPRGASSGDRSARSARREHTSPGWPRAFTPWGAFVQRVGAEQARGGSIDTLSAIAKIFTSESEFAICDRALQLHGALGFLGTTGVARMLRDCRITRIFEGANDVLLVRVGAARLASREPLAPIASPELGALARRLEAAVGDVRARLGLAAMTRQLLLQRIAQAEIALRVGLVAAQTEHPWAASPRIPSSRRASGRSTISLAPSGTSAPPRGSRSYSTGSDRGVARDETERHPAARSRALARASSGVSLPRLAG